MTRQLLPEPVYRHRETGEIKDRDGWMECWMDNHTPEEIEKRNVSIEQAFMEDEGSILVEVTQLNDGSWVEVDE